MYIGVQAFYVGIRNFNLTRNLIWIKHWIVCARRRSMLVVNFEEYSDHDG